MQDNATLRGRCYETHTPFRWGSVLLFVASLMGCGGVVGSAPAQPPPPPPVTVTVNPTGASLLLGGTQNFTATVSNASSTAVNWSVNGMAGGNAAVGTVDATGAYTAPQILPSVNISLTATSAADPSVSGSASISVSSSFTLAVTGPASAQAGMSAGYSATLTPAPNSNPSRAISWSVAGPGCMGANCGAISAAGVYAAPAAPPSPASVEITATPQADPSRAASIAVAILPPVMVGITPGTSSLMLGETQAFTATVTNASTTAVSWSVNGIAGGNAAVGTVDASGNYTAPQILPPAGTSISLAATSVADPSVSASASISVSSSFSFGLTGPSSVRAGNSASYSATLTPAQGSNPSRAIDWSLTGPGCDGATCGTISTTGVYAAPPAPPSPANLQITATPQADPSKAASVAVSILPALIVSISPASATVPLGASAAFQATVTGVQDTSVTWFVNGVVGGNAALGSILNSQANPDSTTYTAPLAMPAGGTVTIVAQSNADPTVSAGATITFSTTVNLRVAPTTASVALGEAQAFQATVNNTANQNVTWAVNGIPGGNAVVGFLCAPGSSPCQPFSGAAGGPVQYMAPAGMPSPNPVTITATSQANPSASASASATILPHVIVSVQPGSVALAGTEELRFTASVTGTENQQVVWQVSGADCANPGTCGSIDATGLYTAPAAAPAPNQIDVIATSLEDTSQTATATVSISSGPAIFSLAPTSAYAGSAGGFTLLIAGNNFAPSVPGPGATILVTGSARVTSCLSPTQCITSLDASDLVTPGNLSVQLENPDGSLSNPVDFVVLAPGSAPVPIALTPGAPSSDGNDIVVVELSTNGGSGTPGNVSLNVGAVGPYSAATASCILGGNPVVIQRPSSGTATGDLCVFSLSALDPSFTFAITGPPSGGIAVINREPLGLGMLHLTLAVPASAPAGPATLFIENPEKDQAAGTGVLEVQ